MNYDYCCNKDVTFKLNLYGPNLIYDFFFPRGVFHFPPVKSDGFRLRPKENNNIITIIVMTPLLIMNLKKTGNVPIM
jgi:hypothetical protein